MKRKILMLLLLMGTSSLVFAQYKEKEEKDEEEKPSFKENLFTGGSVALAFYNNTFLIGASPVLGYSLTNWIDAGIVFNYNYTSYRDYFVYDDRLRQKVYGPGAFVKIYPVRFIFLQAQAEHNFISQKYIPTPNSGQANSKITLEANSFLVGGGYTTGRDGRGGQPFYSLSVLFDVAKAINSPYTDANGRILPIIRGGIQIPLFQGNQGGSRRRR